MNINTENTDSKLFGTISYQSDDSLEKFMNSISENQAIYLIKLALQFSHHSGIFNMNETEVLNKSIRVLSKKIFDNDESKVEE